MKKVEHLKQDLINQFDYSILSIFRSIDQFSHGKITSDNLRTFLLNFECAANLQDEDIKNWIRRFDRDCDGGLLFADLVTALQTMTNYARRDLGNVSQQQLSKNLTQDDAQSQGAMSEIHNNDRNRLLAQSVHRQAKSEKGSIIGISKGNMSKTTGFTTAIGDPHTIGNFSDTNAGDILNYPYSYDQDRANEVIFQEKLYKAGRDESFKLAETRTSSLYPMNTNSTSSFALARDFAEALCDMCVLEGQLEKKRRDLALRTDFNLCDTYKLFLNLQMGKPGIDCDDVYAAIT